MSMRFRAVHATLGSLSLAGVLLIVGCDRMPLSPTDGDTSFLTFNSEAGDWVGGGLSRRYPRTPGFAPSSTSPSDICR